jgi:hypothetical protein
MVYIFTKMHIVKLLVLFRNMAEIVSVLGPAIDVISFCKNGTKNLK